MSRDYWCWLRARLAAAAFAEGAAWVRQAGSTLGDAGERRRWCEDNPIHRDLLAR